MTVRTHVSMGGCLYKLYPVPESTEDWVLLGRGRLVNPKGYYADAPIVELYQAQRKYTGGLVYLYRGSPSNHVGWAGP